MGAQKYHIGKNGPAPCRANPEKPGGRECRFGAEDHGTKEELTERWEARQAAENGAYLESASKSLGRPLSYDERSTVRHLSDRTKYQPPKKLDVRYSNNEQTVAMNLALSNLSELAHSPIVGRDDDWNSDGSTSVDRYELKNGTTGYFKAFSTNSYDESFFRGKYGVSSIGASVNEVNAHRMSKLLGGEFSELVPETTFREVYGRLGTIQQEVSENEAVSHSFIENGLLREDYRRAAIFDFVIGNLDRHGENYLYGVEEGRRGEPVSRLRLIDNSFSFPDPQKASAVNASSFSDNTGAGEGKIPWAPEYGARAGELKLTEADREALTRARAGVREWIDAKTIGSRRGFATIRRIDHLLDESEVPNFSQYHYKHYASPDWYVPEEEIEDEGYWD